MGQPQPVWIRLAVSGSLVRAQFTGVTGDVAKGSDGAMDLRPGAGVEMGLQGGEDGDQSVDVVDSDTHLWRENSSGDNDRSRIIPVCLKVFQVEY